MKSGELCKTASFEEVFINDSKFWVSLVGIVVVKEEKPQTRMRAESAPPRKRHPSERNIEEVLFLFFAMGVLMMLW